MEKQIGVKPLICDNQKQKCGKTQGTESHSSWVAMGCLHAASASSSQANFSQILTEEVPKKCATSCTEPHVLLQGLIVVSLVRGQKKTGSQFAFSAQNYVTGRICNSLLRGHGFKFDVGLQEPAEMCDSAWGTQRQAWQNHAKHRKTSLVDKAPQGLFNISQCSSLRFRATIGSARLHLNLGMFGRQNQQMPREIFSHCAVNSPPSTGVPACVFSCQLRYIVSTY